MKDIDNLNNYKILGKEHIQLGELDLAIEKLKLHHEKNPEDVETLSMLGDVYKEKLQPNTASEFYAKVLEIDPINTAILLKYSSLHLDAPYYINTLRNIHKRIKPKTYVEIGVCRGESFRLADPNYKAIGVDPEPQLDLSTLPTNHKVVKSSSDDYFNSDEVIEDLSVDSFQMAFLDGMHLFEYALRDFMNLEKYATSESVIFVHDLYPMNAETATRQRNSDFWTGDVWKLFLCLTKYRPDLSLTTLPCPPSGLGVIENLNSNSNVLKDNYERICEEYIDLSYDFIKSNAKSSLFLVDADHQWLSHD